jgi:hypothetical protein
MSGSVCGLGRGGGRWLGGGRVAGILWTSSISIIGTGFPCYEVLLSEEKIVSLMKFDAKIFLSPFSISSCEGV